MEYLSREQIISELRESFEPYLTKYNLDEIGVFEEEGQDNHYYIGYTVNKDGKTFHIHSPFIKNQSGELTPEKYEWVIETDEPNGKDIKVYKDIEEALKKLY